MDDAPSMDVVESLTDLEDPPAQLLEISGDALLQCASLQHLHLDAEDPVLGKGGAEVGDHSGVATGAEDCCFVDEVADVDEGWIDECL